MIHKKNYLLLFINKTIKKKKNRNNLILYLTV